MTWRYRIPIGFGFFAAVECIRIICAAVVEPAVARVHLLFGIAVHEEEVVALAEGEDAAGQVVLESKLAAARVVTVEAVSFAQTVRAYAVICAAQRVIFF